MKNYYCSDILDPFLFREMRCRAAPPTIPGGQYKKRREADRAGFGRGFSNRM